MVVARYEAIEWEEGDLGDSRRGTEVWVFRQVSLSILELPNRDSMERQQYDRGRVCQ